MCHWVWAGACGASCFRFKVNRCPILSSHWVWSGLLVLEVLSHLTQCCFVFFCTLYLDSGNKSIHLFIVTLFTWEEANLFKRCFSVEQQNTDIVCREKNNKNKLFFNNEGLENNAILLLAKGGFQKTTRQHPPRLVFSRWGVQEKLNVLKQEIEIMKAQDWTCVMVGGVFALVLVFIFCLFGLGFWVFFHVWL